MGRPREFDLDDVLEQAMLTFWRHGYLGTGIQELVTTTGINRASLYGAFGNKQQIFLAALAGYTDICVSELDRALNSQLGAVAGIRAMLDHFLEGLRRDNRGCMLYNTALETALLERPIRDAVASGIQRIESLIVDHVRTAQANGEIRGDARPVTLARSMMAAMQSMTVNSAIGAANEVLEDIRDGAMLIFGRTRMN